MNHPNTISIIIPLTRPTVCLEKILSLKSDKVNSIEFIFVIDNPKEKFIKWITNLSKKSQRNIEIIVNSENIGAPKSRNRGLEKASGELILFLDDDVIPDEKLIDKHIEGISSGDYLGVIGTTIIEFDESNKFEYAIKKSGFSYAFNLAKDYNQHSWGPTCNISILKERINKIRFKEEYPKAGGGEDVNFCWDMRMENENRIFKVSSEAKVIHPPWKGIKSNYKRFKRWGEADPILFNKHPEKRFRDWPNFWEISILLMVISIVLGIVISPWILLQFPTAIILCFTFCSLQEAKNTISDFRTGVIIESIIIWHEFGRLIQLIKMLKLHQLLIRTQYYDGYSPKMFRKNPLKKFLITLAIWGITMGITLSLVLILR